MSDTKEATALAAPEGAIEKLSRYVHANASDFVALRRSLHAQPELSHREFETTNHLSDRLERAGFDVEVREEGTGFYADLTPEDFDPGVDPTIAIRSDLDALPIQEENDVPYRSQNEGIMHACGHDVHMAIVTGTGLSLANITDKLNFRLRLVFQHAEEVVPGGAAEMISFGAVDGVDYIIGLHCDPELEVGRVGLKKGTFTAAFDKFIFEIEGQGGHGARPHNCVDPILVATNLANALYEIPNRYFDARHPVIVSIGSIQAGRTANVIPEKATIKGTLRTLSHEHREKLNPLLNKIAGGICMTHGASYDLDIHRGAPAIVNDDAVIEAIAREAREVLEHDDPVHEIPLPSMGGEDFSYYLQHARGAMFRLGTASPGPHAQALLHSSRFDVDERVISVAIKLLGRSILRLANRAP